MACPYFKAVEDPRKRATAGVLGYCAGYCDEKLRIPSLGEYQRHCAAERQIGCAVFDFRAQEGSSFVFSKDFRGSQRER